LSLMFEIAVLVVSTLGGALGAVTGFGIGSILTPLLALLVDTRLAVAAMSVPHVSEQGSDSGCCLEGSIGRSSGALGWRAPLVGWRARCSMGGRAIAG
jgi:hypothetical protein